jgi:hypothetical protein
VVDGSDGVQRKPVIGICLRPAALGSVELELMEIADLFSQLLSFTIGADPTRVEFVELPEDGDEDVKGDSGEPSASSIMERDFHNAQMRPYRDRVALARSMTHCTWESFKAACAEHGMTPGQSAAQLRALLAPYWAAQEAAELQQRRSHNDQ